MNRSEYRDIYLKSPGWVAFRSRILTERKHCELCGLSGQCCIVFYGHGLDLHHLTYERLGAELPEDVQVLCRACHEKEEDSKNPKGTTQHFKGWPGVIEFPCPECGEDTGVILFKVRAGDALVVPHFWTRCQCTEPESGEGEDEDPEYNETLCYEDASWYIEEHFDAIQAWRKNHGDLRR